VADQAASGTMAEAAGNTGSRGLDVQTGLSQIPESHHGRPASWVAVSIIIVGFIVGGIALTVGPTWWLFWLGTAIAVIGSIFAASVRVFDDWY
jgi:type IV secretory pathway VirB2 component (pilin)